jgi:hypothetical protein
VARTLLDLAAVVPTRKLRYAWEQAERIRLLDLRQVHAVIERGRGRKGVAGLRALVAEASAPPDTRSELEQRFVEVSREHGLSLPSLNCVVAGHTVDAFWPAQKLIVELDGFAYHRSRAAFERDRVRDADLQLAGYRVLRFTARTLAERPEFVALAIRRFLRSPTG